LLAIWHRVALTGKPWVSLPSNVMADFRFGPSVKSRAIAELERAGLIRVRRGQPVMVSLVFRGAGSAGAD
jgi:DNA-binding transcriptional regulator YhcF (GntR family)